MGILKRANPAPSDAKPSTTKVKTKAKQRYLKRKKERKKTKTKTPSAKPTKAHTDSDGTDDENVVVEEEDLVDSGVQADVEMEEVIENPRKERKPKKRPKLDTIEAEEDVPVDESPAPKPRSPTPPVALPSFPRPALPNAPSKSVLARQGLDQALLDAEIVNAASVLPIPPDGEVDGGTYLSERMRKRLKELGIEELFAVQTCLLPFLLRDPSQRELYLPYSPPRDVCASAPTGSGKTLAYVLPIVEILSTRIVTRLRALIVLPTRDLVIQVRETFEAIGKGRGLKIATATGQHSFAHEQAQLIAEKTPRFQGGSSKVDILICTPGRLIDHLNGTPNFTLQHLRFLVIDEADRLLAQSFQDWLNQVLAATRPPAQTTPVTHQNGLDNPIGVSTSYSDSVAPAFLHSLPWPDIPCFLTERKESSCQKLLFSATLTSDPGKLAALDLKDPKYFVVQSNKASEGEDDAMLGVVMEKFTMPTTLSEHYIVCTSSQKPLVLFHLVQVHHVTNALVFTKSAESTTRLVQLFDFFEHASTHPPNHKPIIIRSYSSDLPTNERRSILEKFKAQEIQILVCSDLISRGIDISHVSHVVSYDAPVDMRKYVHRVGRTARAGRSGDAWTLVEEQEARYFKSMMQSADHLDRIRRVKINAKALEPISKSYEVALDRLRNTYIR